MPFEPYEGQRPRRHQADPTATIQPESGRVTLSAAAVKDVQDATRPNKEDTPAPLEAVNLFFDRRRHIIGIQPVPQGTPRSSRVRRQHTGTTVVFAAKGFLDHFGIDIGHASRRFPTFTEGGLLCIDLTKESEVVIGSRTRQRSKHPATDSAALSEDRVAPTQEPATVG